MVLSILLFLNLVRRLVTLHSQIEDRLIAKDRRRQPVRAILGQTEASLSLLAYVWHARSFTAARLDPNPEPDPESGW